MIHAAHRELSDTSALIHLNRRRQRPPICPGSSSADPCDRGRSAIACWCRSSVSLAARCCRARRRVRQRASEAGAPARRRLTLIIHRLGVCRQGRAPSPGTEGRWPLTACWGGRGFTGVIWIMRTGAQHLAELHLRRFRLGRVGQPGRRGEKHIHPVADLASVFVANTVLLILGAGAIIMTFEVARVKLGISSPGPSAGAARASVLGLAAAGRS